MPFVTVSQYEAAFSNLPIPRIGVGACKHRVDIGWSKVHRIINRQERVTKTRELLRPISSTIATPITTTHDTELLGLVEIGFIQPARVTSRCRYPAKRTLLCLPFSAIARVAPPTA